MVRFKGIVQIYREFIVEAATPGEAMEKIREEAKPNLLSSDRININEPRNLDKPKKVFKPKGGVK